MKPRILLIEDHPIYQSLGKAILEKEFFVEVASTGEKALELTSKNRYDIILLDLILPDVNGLQICTAFKSQKNTANIPILMITGNDEKSDIVKGFQYGASDYITKPYQAQELVLRIKAQLRDTIPRKRINLGSLTIDTEKLRVLNDSGLDVELSRIEFKILHYFATHPEHIINRDQLMTKVWGDNYSITSRTIDSHISNLRKKLSQFGINIRALRGLGYKLEANLIKSAA